MKLNDPKYIPRNDGLWHEDGYKIPEDEPCMTLRGKDIGCLPIIVAYIEMLESNPLNKTIESHLLSSTERLKCFYEYQVNNPLLQSVGCSTESHESSDEYLKLAKDKLIALGEL